MGAGCNGIFGRFFWSSSIVHLNCKWGGLVDKARCHGGAFNARVKSRHYSGSSLCGAALNGAENNEAALDGAPFDRADLTFGTCNDGGLLGGDGKNLTPRLGD